ncbi:CHAP domain-containing protein [Streptomyces aurantiacus]|uniref:Peptidase C51 domain-containing protein n=1 Tax=Streptomyces aurantiacus JA 4570 TaxID=1286094 RepID=S3ZDW5_9ACTN|nr:CHAP domain-containing protein [Streptomyces aurantiacus]EPH40839.1 hypothetical protein STRAU_6054 [Streptomyces aurantiacus JA 4570]
MSVERMIAAAEKSLGLGEPNAIQRWYRKRNGGAYAGNFAWCNAAVTYWSVLADEHDTVCLGTDYAYTVAHAARFKAAGQWHSDVAGIRRGDIVFFDWGGTNDIARIDHVGIVTGVSGRYVYTIEGNTADVCARRVRTASTITGYGRPKYKAAATGRKVKVADVAAAARRDPAAPQGATTHKAAVLVVERALVAEGLLAARWVDGSFGTESIKAYAKWQRSKAGGSYTGKDADGVPGKSSLAKLGARHGFNVI